MATAVFSLCALTSTACLWLLIRAYGKTGGRLIVWTAICFAGLALNNLLLVLDHVALRDDNLTWRGIPAAVGLCGLLYGLLAEEMSR